MHFYVYYFLVISWEFNVINCPTVNYNHSYLHFLSIKIFSYVKYVVWLTRATDYRMLFLLFMFCTNKKVLREKNPPFLSFSLLLEILVTLCDLCESKIHKLSRNISKDIYFTLYLFLFSPVCPQYFTLTFWKDDVQRESFWNIGNINQDLGNKSLEVRKLYSDFHLKTIL